MFSSPDSCAHDLGAWQCVQTQCPARTGSAVGWLKCCMRPAFAFHHARFVLWSQRVQPCRCAEIASSCLQPAKSLLSRAVSVVRQAKQQKQRNLPSLACCDHRDGQFTTNIILGHLFHTAFRCQAVLSHHGQSAVALMSVLREICFAYL